MVYKVLLFGQEECVQKQNCQNFHWVEVLLGVHRSHKRLMILHLLSQKLRPMCLLLLMYTQRQIHCCKIAYYRQMLLAFFHLIYYRSNHFCVSLLRPHLGCLIACCLLQKLSSELVSFYFCFVLSFLEQLHFLRGRNKTSIIFLKYIFQGNNRFL